MYLYFGLNVPALVGAKLVDYESECLDTLIIRVVLTNTKCPLGEDQNLKINVYYSILFLHTFCNSSSIQNNNA